ncbi:unnamed protein product [Staurois parvus]|uniref:Uncharacterized protein n=1 Tax=Staurois parvus TaxID=386267 RepID=A0ABN9ENG8_9NEOB|nr:unnamed protein product [Staurois parvus]
MFDSVFSDAPLLSWSPFHLLIEQNFGGKLHMLSLVCIAREFFFFLGGVHVISTGPISTVQTEVRGFASSYSRKKTPPTSFNQCLAEHTDRSPKTALTADEKRYLAVYIY